MKAAASILATGKLDAVSVLPRLELMSRVEDDQLKDGERELLALADEHLRAAVVEYQFAAETAADRVRIERGAGCSRERRGRAVASSSESASLAAAVLGARRVARRGLVLAGGRYLRRGWSLMLVVARGYDRPVSDGQNGRCARRNRT